MNSCSLPGRPNLTPALRLKDWIGGIVGVIFTKTAQMGYAFPQAFVAVKSQLAFLSKSFQKQCLMRAPTFLINMIYEEVEDFPPSYAFLNSSNF